jgi:hypothetical protein
MTETDIDLKDGEDFLCVLAEQGNRRFALVRKGEGLLIRPFDARGPDREFESLPSLLSGLQSFFLELRVADSPAKGFARAGGRSGEGQVGRDRGQPADLRVPGREEGLSDRRRHSRLATPRCFTRRAAVSIRPNGGMM